MGSPGGSKRAVENLKSRETSQDVRDIGAIPKQQNARRRAKCRDDFDAFLHAYWPDDCRHPWSKVHRKLIETIELVVLVGSLLAMGIPRGWGKTFLSVRAVLWAVAYRHHTMAMLIAASDDAAADLLQDVRDELETNDRLQADFPELCRPIASLEGINQRAKAQLCEGTRTRVKAESHELHLGDVCGRPGAVIFAGGLLGSKIRGKRKKRGDVIERPTLGLIDDFQTRRSARSKRMCDERVQVVQDDIAGLPGHDRSWSALLTCTVIEPDDAADQLLDRQRHPDWRGIRQSFLESLPTDDALELWGEWNQIREAALQNDSDEAIAEAAHDFYRQNKTAMQAGAVVAWEHAYDPEHYVDALEKAMHWYFRSRRGFWSELQNQPDKLEAQSGPQLQQHTLAVRRHHCSRHVVPADCEYVTAFADVQKKVLFYELRAWAPDSTGYTIDYGTFPPQRKPYYTLANLKRTIADSYPKLPTWELQCQAAVRDLFVPLFERHFEREDGAVLRLNVAGIDANDETETVKKAIRTSGLQGKLWPFHGRSFRPPKTPLNDLKKRDGDTVGENWRRRNPATGRMRYVTFDADAWKSHLRDRLMQPVETRGALSFFGGREHQMFAEHCCAEYADLLFHPASGRTVEVWALRPNEDNHLWDCAVANGVLGSMLGLKLPAAELLDGAESQPPRKRKRKRLQVSF